MQWHRRLHHEPGVKPGPGRFRVASQLWRVTALNRPVWVGHSCPTKHQHKPCGSDIPVRQSISTGRVGRTFLSDKTSAQAVWVGHYCPTKHQHRPCGSDIPVRQSISTGRVGRTFLSDKASAQAVWVAHSCPTKHRHEPCGSDIPVRHNISTSQCHSVPEAPFQRPTSFIRCSG